MVSMDIGVFSWGVKELDNKSINLNTNKIIPKYVSRNTQRMKCYSLIFISSVIYARSGYHGWRCYVQVQASQE